MSCRAKPVRVSWFITIKGELAIDLRPVLKTLNPELYVNNMNSNVPVSIRIYCLLELRKRDVCFSFKYYCTFSINSGS